MCKKLLVVLFVFCVAGIASAVTWTEIGHWSFDNSANLAQNQYGVPSYVTGTPAVEPGISGSAMACNNTGLSIAVPQSAWSQLLKSSYVMYDFYVYGKSALGFADVESIAFQWEASGQGAYLASLGDIHGGIKGFCWLNGDNYYQQITGWPNPGDTRWADALLDKWAHVQMVYQNNNFSMYLNGSLFVSGQTIMAAGPSTGIAGTVTYGQIGGRTYPGGADNVRGLMDEFKIFIPEPATICMLGLGGLALLRKKRARA